MDTHRRTVAKAVTYQLMGLVVMTALGVLFTGSTRAAGALAVTSAAIGALGYVLHERVWALVPWGQLSARSVPALHMHGLGDPAHSRDLRQWLPGERGRDRE